MSVVVEETENRNSFAGTGETRREGICMRDAEKERRWSAMNGRITHRGNLEGEGNEAACCCPMANRSTASLPRICYCPGHAMAEWQAKKPLPMEEAEGEIDCSCAEKRGEEKSGPHKQLEDR